MHTPIKTSVIYTQNTPLKHYPSPTNCSVNVSGSLNSQYGKRIHDLDDKLTYLEKLMRLMKLDSGLYPTRLGLGLEGIGIHPVNSEKPVESIEKTEKKLKAMNENAGKDKKVGNILDSERILWNMMRLLGINPEDFKESVWRIDESFIMALREQLNVNRCLDGLRAKLPKGSNKEDIEEFFRGIEDLLFVFVMTIDYMRRFRGKSSQKEAKFEVKPEKALQVDSLPDYEAIIRNLEKQIRECEAEKLLFTNIFADKTQALNSEIVSLELKCRGLEERRNEALEIIKEGVLERGLLKEEIERLGKGVECQEVLEDDEDVRRKERRKKYALIDDLHERLKKADRLNKLLAERLQEIMEMSERDN